MKKKSVARQHHYLSQGYLAAFTDTGLNSGKLFALDIHTGHAFHPSPANVGVERDFNGFELEGHPPDILENALSQFEGAAVTSIRRVIASEKFPNDRDYVYILNMLCLFAVRNPQRRRLFNKAREESLHKIADLLVSNKNIWDTHVKMAVDAGVIKRDETDFAEMKSYVNERRYTVEFPTTGNLVTEFETFDKLLPILGNRVWSILVAPLEGPEFICSDHPVTLVWKNKNWLPVGFESKMTEVFFPLGRKVGLYGVYEEAINPVVRVNADRVARFNTRVISNAERQVYSAQERFFFWHSGKIVESVNLADAAKKPNIHLRQ